VVYISFANQIIIPSVYDVIGTNCMRYSARSYFHYLFLQLVWWTRPSSLSNETIN